jgi:dihydroorotate dehydrogenase (fumarate)
MDLSTTYLGLKLPHPLMPGASPMVDDIDNVRRLEDAGASAIVMHSLFEEQISREQVATFVHTESHGQSFAEALTYFPSPEAFALGPDEYLEHVRKVKQAVSVPVFGSLNGFTHGGWLDYAKLIEQAGADALELNVYFLGSDPDESAASIEERTVRMVKAVREAIRIPVAVKLSPYYTSLAQFTTQLDGAGADGLVLFNRFYQPDIDVEELQVRRQIHLSTSAELPLRLTWLALLSPKVKASLAVSGGVHTLLDVVQDAQGRAHAVARGARVPLAPADAGKHEPRGLPGPGGLRTRELHAHAPELEDVTLALDCRRV